MKMTEALYYGYWGKARSDNENGLAYHLLPYHCLDVATVGWQLLTHVNPELLNKLKIGHSPVFIQCVHTTPKQGELIDS
jgi:CRISPR-associated endonuclease/helicase Cas3